MMTTILIVDDEVAILRSVKRVLSEGGKYKIQTADNTKSALDLITPNYPDLIILDIHLCDDNIDGIETIRTIRNNGYNGIICMLTGDTNPDMLFQAAVAGADDYIIKGPTCNLVDEIEYLFTRRIENSENKSEMTTILDNAFLRSIRLSEEQTKLLSDFAILEYPSVKELACKMGISETSLWKRLSRIRDKLGMDCMTQITHLLTTLSIFRIRAGKRKSNNETTTLQNKIN
ncbi:MAG: response regulator transcription factor [Planctomycetes bacterium]|nr:response regulator transcription factor [Planctomycetota bacterium]